VFGNRFSRCEPSYHFNIEEARDLAISSCSPQPPRAREIKRRGGPRETGYLNEVRDGKVVRAELYSIRAAGKG